MPLQADDGQQADDEQEQTTLQQFIKRVGYTTALSVLLSLPCEYLEAIAVSSFSMGLGTSLSFLWPQRQELPLSQHMQFFLVSSTCTFTAANFRQTEADGQILGALYNALIGSTIATGSTLLTQLATERPGLTQILQSLQEACFPLDENDIHLMRPGRD